MTKEKIARWITAAVVTGATLVGLTALGAQAATQVASCVPAPGGGLTTCVGDARETWQAAHDDLRAYEYRCRHADGWPHSTISEDAGANGMRRYTAAVQCGPLRMP